MTNLWDNIGKNLGDVASRTGNIAGNAMKAAADLGNSIGSVAGQAASKAAKGTVHVAGNIKDSASRVDLFNSKLRAKAIED